MASVSFNGKERGVLVVLEGLDCSGKTTQAKRLVDALNSKNIKTELWRYPNRATEIGRIIDKYLRKQIELDDRAVHLLFSANRWEFNKKLKETLNAGTSLVVDRYAYSGVAYTAAKPELDFEWCKQCDAGLVKPDLLIFMDTLDATVDKRSGFGNERYEIIEFQKRVYENFKKLIESKSENVLTLDANNSIETLHDSILSKFVDTLDLCRLKDFTFLW